MEGPPVDKEQAPEQEPTEQELIDTIVEWTQPLPKEIREEIIATLEESLGQPFDVILGNVLTYIEMTQLRPGTDELFAFLVEKGLIE